MKNIRIIEIVDEKKFEIQKRKDNGNWITLKSSFDYIEILQEYLELTNPIKEKRIVNDITFALRFKHFLNDIKVCDAASEEELDYLKCVADKLLDYQVNTAEKNSDEYRYFVNNGLIKEN